MFDLARGRELGLASRQVRRRWPHASHLPPQPHPSVAAALLCRHEPIRDAPDPLRNPCHAMPPAAGDPQGGAGATQAGRAPPWWVPADALKLSVEATLRGHQGCVNRLHWNEAGSLLASGSDDRMVGACWLP